MHIYVLFTPHSNSVSWISLFWIHGMALVLQYIHSANSFKFWNYFKTSLWWEHGSVCRWCVTELYTWNLDGFINQCHPNKVNKSNLKINGTCFKTICWINQCAITYTKSYSYYLADTKPPYAFHTDPSPQSSFIPKESEEFIVIWWIPTQYFNF